MNVFLCCRAEGANDGRGIFWKVTTVPTVYWQNRWGGSTHNLVVRHSIGDIRLRQDSAGGIEFLTARVPCSSPVGYENAHHMLVVWHAPSSHSRKTSQGPMNILFLESFDFCPPAALLRPVINIDHDKYPAQLYVSQPEP